MKTETINYTSQTAKAISSWGSLLLIGCIIMGSLSFLADWKLLAEGEALSVILVLFTWFFAGICFKSMYDAFSIIVENQYRELKAKDAK